MKFKVDGRRPKLDFVWLRRSVSWKVLIATAAVIGLAGVMVIVAGGVDISADQPDGWIARNLLHFVFKRSVATHSADLTPPDDLAAPSRVRLAAQHFDMVCANCHGRPGFGQSVIALSMSPRPQYLPKVVGQFTNSELHQIVEHGVKYSAMPAWPTDARGDEVWSMVAFLRQLPNMDAKSYREMTALPQQATTTPSGSGGDARVQPANARRDAPPTDEFLYAAPSAGFSDQTVHAIPVLTCARCHGADGSGAATGGEAPNLTIQGAAYLQATLQAYLQGARRSGFMENIAAQLSTEQIGALAHYYAGLPVQAVSAPGASPALIQRGQTIALDGIPERAMPACANCHESAGAAIIGAPHIAGQSATFLRRQLGAIGHGGRGSTRPWNPMPAVVHGLGTDDIAALAAYYSSLTPTKPSGGGLSPQGRQAAPAARDVASGLAAAKQIFETRCVTCHVNQGRGDAQGNYPNLTILPEPYAAQSLYAFHIGARPGGKMRLATVDQSSGEMTNLARYLNSLTPQAALAKTDPAAALRGAAIATQGAAARGIPACLGCHGAKGVAALPLIPPLQGQNVFYLHNKLDNFAKPYEANLSALNPMPAIASQLTAQERADLAAYFAAAPLLQKPAARQ